MSQSPFPLVCVTAPVDLCPLAVSVYDSWILDVPSSEAVLRGGGVAALDGLAAVAAEAAGGVADDDDVHP